MTNYVNLSLFSTLCVIFVAVVYRPSDVTFSSDPQFMNRLRSFCSEYNHKIINGDWNVDMSNPSRPDYQSMREIVNEEFLKLIESGPDSTQ